MPQSLLQTSLKLTLSALLSALTLGAGAAQAEKLCTGDSRLAQYEGRYAAPAVLRAFESTRIWSKALEAQNGRYDAVVVDRQGLIHVSYTEHEGDDADCIKREGNRIWVKDRAGIMSGPFLRIGSAEDDNAYLRYVFKGCYLDQDQQQWCLGAHEIKVGARRFKLGTFPLDLTEEPGYGTPIVIEGEEGLWVFVPDGKKWLVYNDTSSNDENDTFQLGDVPHTPIWKTLTPERR